MIRLVTGKTSKAKVKSKAGYQQRGRSEGPRKKRPAIMYKIRFDESRERSPESPIFNLVLNASELPEPNEKGEICLTGFKNNRKERETQPDFNFSVARPKPQRDSAPAPKRQSKSDDDYEF